MESFFLNLGLSYTWSKALPYLIMITLGVFIGIFLFKRSKSLVMKIVSILIIGAPFGIYFAFVPIYEGDFSNGSKIIQHSTETAELPKGTLVVVSMPGCRFCKESILYFKEIKKRHNDINIEYVVTSSDSTHLQFYEEISNGTFPVRLAENPEAIHKLAVDENGVARFPTFVLVQENSLTTWTNKTFGVVALDKVLKSFK